MSQYSQRPGNGGRHARFQEEEDVSAPPNVRRDNVGLSLKERLPLPSSPKPPSNLASPIPPANRSRGPSPLQQSQQSNQSRSKPSPQQSLSQPRTRDPRLNPSSEYENAGRSLTNPSAGRARPGPQQMQQTRPQDQPSDRDLSRQQELSVGVAYGNNGYLSGPQPRYNRPVDYEEVPDIDSKSLMVSPTIGGHASMMNSPRSILIGFDDSVPANLPNTNPTTLGPIPQTQQRRSTNTAPPSSRRGVSSYYSQPAIQVSPIPEESPNIRHNSYASSHVIPSTWGNVDYPAQLSPSMYGEEDEEDNYRPTPSEDDEQKGLVRQASLGRKSKPKITEIRSVSRQDSTKQTFLNSDSPSPAARDSPSPTVGVLPLNIAPPAVSTPNSMKVPSPLMAFSFPVPGNYDGDRKEPEMSSNHLGLDSAAHSRASSMYSATVEPLNTAKSMAARMKGRKAPPPGLNLSAVRDAEARGSLTSLPDLIRRATKLAAVLENGKARTGSSLRGSYTASYLTNSSSNRRTDSISDILASFPPPVPGAGGASRNGRNGSRTSAWPLPSDFIDGNVEHSSLQTAPKKGRKVCGLPLWAFILLVILALLVITAAVVVPLQLVTLSRSQENDSSSDSDADILRQCKIDNPCANGGENVATRDFCGCVCTGGFAGKTCTELDSSCVTMDLEEIKSFGDTFAGIQNATMGSAIKRLLEISTPRYNVQLDGSKMLSAFWASGVSCTAQNALVTFNGKTGLEESTTISSSVVPTTTPAPARRVKKRLEDPSVDDPLVYDTSVIGTKTQDPYPLAPPTATPTPSITTPGNSGATALPGNRIPALDEDAVDFSRVVVLFLVQDKGLSVAVTAQENLQSMFTVGVDYGSVDVGNQVSVDLDNRVVNLPGGISVGELKTSS